MSDENYFIPEACDTTHSHPFLVRAPVVGQRVERRLSATVFRNHH